jgi:hypothetical protein
MDLEAAAELFSTLGRRTLKQRRALLGALTKVRSEGGNTSSLGEVNTKRNETENTAAVAAAELATAYFVGRRQLLTVSACPPSLPLCRASRRQQRHRAAAQQRLAAAAAAKVQLLQQEAQAAAAASRAVEHAKVRAVSALARDAERARAAQQRAQQAADAAASLEIESMDAAARNRLVLLAFLRAKRSAQKLRGAVGQGGGARRGKGSAADADAMLKQANEVREVTRTRGFLGFRVAEFSRARLQAPCVGAATENQFCLY